MMRRRARIDLGQEPSAKEVTRLERKSQRWAQRNPDKLDENPFLKALRPFDNDNYGDPTETGDQLRARLANQEFGNFPGYFNYRNNAARETDGQAKKRPRQNDEIDEHSKTRTNREKREDHSLDPLAKVSPPEESIESGLQDERLQSMEQEWFKGKRVLDIGCNRGHITYAIARLFAPKSVIGIDIDQKMINMANRDIQMHLDGAGGLIDEARERRLSEAKRLHLAGTNPGQLKTSTCDFPLACYIGKGPLILEEGRRPSAMAEPERVPNTNGPEPIGNSIGCVTSESEIQFPNNLVFLEHNYVLANDELVSKQSAQFDTIVCLSVTKWIHLNYRDDGLKRFFRRVYNHLRPGGLFVLEAQPFDNYGRRKRLSERLKANYYSIQLKPDQFDAYLLSDQVGFRRIIHESLTSHKCRGFERPLKVFAKE